MVRVFVLGMSGVAGNPSEIGLVTPHRSCSLLPQFEILDCSALSLPATLDPLTEPGVHSLDDVLGIAVEQHLIAIAAARDLTKRFDYRPKRHAVVGRSRLGDPVVAAGGFFGFWLRPFD